MAAVTTCPSCGRRNRVPLAAPGKPACAVCRAALPWIVPADDDSFDAAVATGVAVLVDMWAPWCGPCRLIGPVLEQLAGDRAGRVKVVKVNVDDAPGVASRFEVHSIPTLLLLDRGTVVDRQVGSLSGAMLRAWLDAHLTRVS